MIFRIIFAVDKNNNEVRTETPRGPKQFKSLSEAKQFKKSKGLDQICLLKLSNDQREEFGEVCI